MKFLLLIIGALLFTVALQGQYSIKHTVYFEKGQSSISLNQLDSIKQIAKQSKATINGRIVVHTYANDALEGDSNFRLSGRRAFLLQECLQREGIDLSHLQIKNKVRHVTEQEGCGTCADILLTTDTNFFFQNVYQDQVADFLMEGSSINAQTFWVKPFEDVLVSSKHGVLIRIPAGSLATKDSALVKLEVRYLKNKWDMLLHSLATRSVQQEFLDLNRAIHLSVSQFGEPLEMRNNQHITVIAPSDVYSKKAKVYQQEGASWVPHLQSDDLKVGSFFAGESYYCNDSNTALVLPKFLNPPAKPVYLIYDSMTIHQDKLLKTIKVRMDHLEEQKFDKKGKAKKLSPQQKHIEYTLKTKKDRLLIAKEKIKINTREKNEATKADYYKTLAKYNKSRNALQQAYLKDLGKLGAEQKEKSRRCQQHKESVKHLRQEYSQEAYQQITAALINQNINNKLGYWMQTNQLGWLSVGKKANRNNDNAVPYRVTSAISTYKVTAFLIFDETQDIIIGESLGDTDIIFWGVPDQKSAKLLAVTQKEGRFLVAFHQLTTSGNPVKLEFKNESLRNILGEFK